MRFYADHNDMQQSRDGDEVGKRGGDTITNDPAAAIAWLHERPDNRAKDKDGDKWKILGGGTPLYFDKIEKAWLYASDFPTLAPFTMYRRESKKQLREQLATVTEERDDLVHSLGYAEARVAKLEKVIDCMPFDLKMEMREVHKLRARVADLEAAEAQHDETERVLRIRLRELEGRKP